MIFVSNLISIVMLIITHYCCFNICEYLWDKLFTLICCFVEFFNCDCYQRWKKLVLSTKLMTSVERLALSVSIVRCYYHF